MRNFWEIIIWILNTGGILLSQSWYWEFGSSQNIFKVAAFLFDHLYSWSALIFLEINYQQQSLGLNLKTKIWSYVGKPEKIKDHRWDTHQGTD